MPKAEYDFNFICLSFGLVPINGATAAIMPGAITHIERADNGEWILVLHGGTEFGLDDAGMAELEQTIKARSEQTKALQREAIKAQMLMQAEAAMDLQNGPSISKPRLDGIPIIGKRFKQ